jgi:hypothetical protein
MCQHAEYDADDGQYYCNRADGLYAYEEVTHANFDGCQWLEMRDDA